MMLRDNARVRALQDKLTEVRAELNDALAEAASGEVRNYEFTTLHGPTTLSDLFGAKRDLFVIHNMGISCHNCTMWADGFNGLYPHVADRAAFVVASPDTPKVQADFAASRGWRFPMVSHAGTSFARDMGFLSDAGRHQAGVSAFQRKDGRITRASAAMFQPDDSFCPVWRLFDLLPEGADGWRAKDRYD